MLAFLVFVAGLALAGMYVAKRVMARELGVLVVVKGLGILAVFFVLSQLVSSVVIVGAGERVVVFDKFTGVKKEALGEGFHLIMPFVQDAITYDVRIQKPEFETTAASKDLQDVATTVALNFQPVPESVPTIYQNFGKDYVEKAVHPAVQESVKAVTALYTAEELITKRDEVKRKTQDHLAALLAPNGIKLADIFITNFKFSEDFSNAIEAKQIAEQNALKALNTLEQVKIEAEQKVATARAEADSLKLQKEQITPQLLELRRIEAQREAIAKWNGQMPQMIMGGNAVPFLNINTDK